MVLKTKSVLKRFYKFESNKTIIYPHSYPSQIEYEIKLFNEFTNNYVKVETTMPSWCEKGRIPSHSTQGCIIFYKVSQLESELLRLLYYSRAVKWYLIRFKVRALKLQRV